MTPTITDSWVDTRAAVESLCISRSKLHELKRSRVFKPGEHWIKASGTHGRLLWCIPAIRSWQVPAARKLQRPS